MSTSSWAIRRSRAATWASPRSGATAIPPIALLLITGLGLGALYFLIAAGLSLIWGLMRVLNFAHGAFFTVAAYAGWTASGAIGGTSPEVRWLVALVVAVVVGGIFAALTEIVLIRPL